jgi:hypothetical protein
MIPVIPFLVELEAIRETVEIQDYRRKISQMIEYDRNRNQGTDDQGVSFVVNYRIPPSPPETIVNN